MAPSKRKSVAAEAAMTAPQSEEDIPMADAADAADAAAAAAAAASPASAKEATPEDDHDPAVLAFGEQRIRLLPGATDTAASFEFRKEDHTLGNALRYIIMKNPNVEFCGYSIPHPSEEVMNIRIQTWEGTATEALEKGFDDLMALCDVVTGKFEVARAEFTNQDAMDV